MGWSLRKTFKVGPLNLNLSTKGIGASVGVRGARVGVNAKGKGYVRGNIGPPYYQEQFGGKRKARQAPQPEVTVADVVADLNDVLNWMADLTWADVKRALKYVTVIATIAAALYLAQQIYLLF